jgi:hypothetical protein
MTWIVVPILRRTKKPRVVHVPARQVPARQVFTRTIRGVLARPLGGGRVEEIGPAAITLNQRRPASPRTRRATWRTIEIDQVAGLSRGDSSNDAEPAGTLDLDRSQTPRELDPDLDRFEGSRQQVLHLVRNLASQVGVATSRTV